jgi:hypothetical protein
MHPGRFTPELNGQERIMVAALLAVLLTAGLIAAGCGGGDGGDDGDGYPADVVSNFLASCEPSAVESSQGALTAEDAREICRCVVDELQQTLPLDDFREYEARLREGEAEPPDEVTEALGTCTESLGGGE